MAGSTPARIAIEPLTMTALPPKTRVSVAIICFNYGRFLGECLDSCLAQTVGADEIIVVNDGSTDDSAEVLDGYASRFPIIRAIHQPNAGICAATNAALAACSGDVVLLLDADDTMAPQRIEMVLAALRRPLDGHHPGWVHHLMMRFSDTHSDLGLAPYCPGGKGPEGWLATAALNAASCTAATFLSAAA